MKKISENWEGIPNKIFFLSVMQNAVYDSLGKKEFEGRWACMVADYELLANE